jgi:formylglycine-generating enzyme required for sulfatase activity
VEAGRESAANRVLRGGSWNDNARNVRAAYRNDNDPADRNDDIGFRCARAHERVGASAPEQAGFHGVAGDSRRSPKRDGGRRAGRDARRRPERSPACRRDGSLTMARIIDASLHPLMYGEPPDWASGWGQDRFGVYVAFTIRAVTQRLRWIPPGRFLMGSPNGEEGRFSAEGPRHEVTLAEGFWLFDTPCTQALWQAVMGENPSRFKSPTRPVEQVSFEDVRGFLDKLNGLVPDLGLTLPSEAQWEYACRAGTETATYAGDMRIVGERNVPVLDAIAWYSGNSGVGFELDNGYDSSDWKEKQYDHTRAGTRPVAQKAANPWGLYDMLGNVWEWCDDRWHDSYRGAPTDGSAWIDPGGAADRVVRGGSWINIARLVRAAFRNGYDPAFGYDLLGFRCARVQCDSVASETERRAGRSKRRERSDQAATTSPKRR